MTPDVSGARERKVIVTGGARAQRARDTSRRSCLRPQRPAASRPASTSSEVADRCAGVSPRPRCRVEEAHPSWVTASNYVGVDVTCLLSSTPSRPRANSGVAAHTSTRSSMRGSRCASSTVSRRTGPSKCGGRRLACSMRSPQVHAVGRDRTPRHERVDQRPSAVITAARRRILHKAKKEICAGGRARAATVLPGPAGPIGRARWSTCHQAIVILADEVVTTRRRRLRQVASLTRRRQSSETSTRGPIAEKE